MKNKIRREIVHIIKKRKGEKREGKQEHQGKGKHRRKKTRKK